MTAEQIVTNQMTVWPPNRTATRDLDDVFSHMVIKDLKSEGLDIYNKALLHLTTSTDPYIIVSVSSEVFDWESAEQRADWEENHGRFMEFSDVKDLLSDLHS